MNIYWTISGLVASSDQIMWLAVSQWQLFIWFTSGIHLNSVDTLDWQSFHTIAGRLCAESERQIRMLYQRTIRHSTDPYKRWCIYSLSLIWKLFVYAVLYCCDTMSDVSGYSTNNM